MNAPSIDLLPENDRTNGWTAHLPLRTLRPPGTDGTSQGLVRTSFGLHVQSVRTICPHPLMALSILGVSTWPPTCRTYSASFAATRTASPSSVGCQPNRITPSRYRVPSPKPLESTGRYSCSAAALRFGSTRQQARWRPWMLGTCSRGRRTSLSSNANSRS